MPSRIEDYAIIGDCQTAALVAKDGSIDWLCFPRFDGGACFAALLGTNEHGRWQIAPRGEVRSTRRRYRDNTLVLETEFETDEGMVSVIDFMPLRQDGADVIRIVVGRRGRVRMKMEFVLRFDYGSIVPWVTQCKHGIRAIAGPDTVYLRSPIGLQGKDFKTTADFEVSEGETIPFALGWSPTYGKPPEERDCQDALRETERWWHEWSSRCTYAGEYREAVLRSLITLKALTYAPTGGICAAATTSLPEEIGGVRNWDYRFCWLRDATFSLMALEGGGYHEEAAAWRKWLVDAAAGTPAKLQIMYGLAGERRLTELELDWLPGYEASKPVRIGNGAFLQRQLDVYGEVMDALYQSNCTNLSVDDEAWHLQRALARHLVTAWKEPDEGIWEVRGPRQQFTHSKVMTWVAMDRAIKTLESLGDPDNEVVKWKTTRDEIHATVCHAGFDAKLNSFVQYFGSTDPDASLLMIPLVGFLPATDKRMRGTIDLIRKRLTRNGLIDRYPANAAVDGLPPGEGSFLMCTFWLVDNLALLDKGAEATEIFERLLALRNDVGLLSEQYDTIHQRLVGNFPQAFSHVGLINSAANLDGVHGPARLRCQNRATLHRA